MNPGATETGPRRLRWTLLATGIVLLAIAAHSLFYADFFEDPMTWALLGVVGLSARVPKKPPPASTEVASPPPATAVSEPPRAEHVEA